MKITFARKLTLGFVLCSLLIAAIAFLFEYFGYFGFVKVARARILFLVFFSIVFGSLFGYSFGLYLIRHIKNLMEATSVMSKGDLRHKIEITSADELGTLAMSFNRMMESLVQMLTEVKKGADAIYDSSMNLSATSNQMHESTQEISATVQNIAKGAGVQAEMGMQTHLVTKEIAQSIEVIAEKADAANRLAQEVFAKAQEGNLHTQNAVEKIADVAAKIENASKLVMGFRDRTLEINNAVRMIATIAQQTHLLALNATIEAAKAGEHGRGFAVVAEEVRKLSDETKKLAGQISELADTINFESQQVLASMSDSNASASQSKEVVYSASRALQDIVNDVQFSVSQVQEITRLTREQTESSTRLVTTIEQIARIAEDNASGTQEATAATEEQNAAMRQLASAAQELSHTSDRLKSCISLFQY